MRQSASCGEHAAVAAWRERQAGLPVGRPCLIVGDNQRRERLNALIRADLKRDSRLGESIHIGGCEFASVIASSRVATIASGRSTTARVAR